MVCIVCGKQSDVEICSRECELVYNRTIPVLVRWFLQQNNISYLKEITELRDSGTEEVKPSGPVTVVATEGEQEALDVVWKESPMLRSMFDKKPDITQPRKCSAIILRAKRNKQIVELGSCSPQEMNENQLFSKLWDQKWSRDGYIPDFKLVY